jgi:acyl-CoA thioester hydrolase
MAHQFSLVRRVEFYETDMAGIVHYSNFFRYMEAVEHAFFRSLGHSVVLRDFDPPLGLPRVHSECDYFSPLRFEDEFEVTLFVAEKRTKSLRYLFRFCKLNSDPVIRVAAGGLTVVCVRHHRDGAMKSAAIPSSIADLIEVAPREILHSAGFAVDEPSSAMPTPAGS